MPPRGKLAAARRHLDSHLFPDSPPRDPAVRGWEAAGLALALFAIAVVAELARIGWSASLDSLWAEDGQIFLQNAMTRGFFDAVTAEYAGYLVLVPRLIGEAASALPLRDAPEVFSILAAAVAALSGFVVWHATAGHISSPILRGTLVLLTVLTPVGGLETIDSAAYVAWYMLFACFWILLWRPRTTAGAVLGGAFLALTALSSPGVWFFIPVALLRLLAARDRRDFAILAGYFGGGVLQIVAVASSSYEGPPTYWTADIWTVLLQRVVDGAAFGLRLGGGAWVVLGWPFLILLTVAMVIGLAVGVARSDLSVRWLAGLAVPIALVMFVVSIYQRAVATPMLWPENAWNGAAGRYSLVPAMLLVSVFVAIVDRSWKGRSWSDRGSWPGIAVVAVLLGSMLVSLPARDIAQRGAPPWEAAVDDAERVCRDGATSDAVLHTSPENFGLTLPCSAIPGSSDASAQR
jgi:hypothetical protein